MAATIAVAATITTVAIVTAAVATAATAGRGDGGEVDGWRWWGETVSVRILGWSEKKRREKEILEKGWGLLRKNT